MAEDFRVLIVDDDFHVARLHVGYVDAVPGFTALDPVGAGETAVRAINALRPDLVLMDVYLPDANGLDILRGLDVDAFVLSAASDAESIRKAVRRGALAYLIKPFNAELLAARLKAYARYRRILADETSLDQETLERALRVMHPGDIHGGRPRSVTELAVLTALTTASGACSAADVAQQVGISRATAQRYLSGLVEEGAVEVVLRYGSTGRPEHRYNSVLA